MTLVGKQQHKLSRAHILTGEIIWKANPVRGEYVIVKYTFRIICV